MGWRIAGAPRVPLALTVATVAVLTAGTVVAVTRGTSPCTQFAVGSITGGHGGERLLNIFLLDSQLHVIRKVTSDNQSIEPAFSPDGQQIAFATGRGHPIDYELGPLRTSIHVAQLDGTADREVVPDGGSPTWSPDGTRIAFIRNGLWIVDLVTGRQSRISATLPGYSRLQWLADGRIAVIDDKGFSVVSPTGGRLTRLFQTDTRIAVDSTARWLAYSGDMQGGPVRVLNRSSGATTTVPRSATEVALPVGWTSTGELVFTQNVRGPAINIMGWRPGTTGLRRFGQVVTIPPDLAINPRCGPG
jgi:dipeptidyl aminopeptidase/acylaminoacyl peptidase